MGIKSVFINTMPYDYKPKCCEEMAYPPVFKLKALTARQIGRIDLIESKTSKEGETKTDISVMMRNVEACNFGIKGWTIYEGSDDKLTKMSDEDREKATVKFDQAGIENLDPEIITEIGEHLLKRSKLDKDEKENLGSKD